MAPVQNQPEVVGYLLKRIFSRRTFYNSRISVGVSLRSTRVYSVFFSDSSRERGWHFAWCQPANADTLARLCLHYTDIQSQCVLDYLWSRTRWSDNIPIRSGFTMSMWTISGYRSHVNVKCKRSQRVQGKQTVLKMVGEEWACPHINTNYPLSSTLAHPQWQCSRRDFPLRQLSHLIECDRRL